jgi:hypothetical protein
LEQEVIMLRRQLLFVTYYDEHFGEGLPYACELAKLLNEGISILLIYKRNNLEKFANQVATITFAEANENKIAKELIGEYGLKDKKVSDILEKFQRENINVDVCFETGSIESEIESFLRKKTFVDMILLSPNVVNNGKMNPLNLNRLAQTALRPVITITRQMIEN